MVGDIWGEVNIEKAAALKPDLIVDEYWPASKEWGSGNDLLGPQSPMVVLAPVTGVSVGNSVIALIEDYEALAASLGAGASDAALADKARFEASREAFIAATAAKPNLTVLAVSPRDTALYVATPAGTAELLDFVAWGLNSSSLKPSTSAATSRP